MSENNKKRSIYARIQQIRVSLASMDLKKSGYNPHSKFNYYELSDFLPAVNKLMLENDLTTDFCMDKESAKMKVIDVDGDYADIVFEMPVEVSKISATNGMQQLGGTMTYARRYLYMSIFDIAVCDSFDSQPNEDNEDRKNADEEKKAEREYARTRSQKIGEAKINSIRSIAKSIGIAEAVILSHYNINDLGDITEEMYPNVMANFEAEKRKNGGK